MYTQFYTVKTFSTILSRVLRQFGKSKHIFLETCMYTCTYFRNVMKCTTIFKRSFFWFWYEHIMLFSKMCVIVEMGKMLELRSQVKLQIFSEYIMFCGDLNVNNGNP